MEVKQINQLMEAMRKSGITRLVLKQEGHELELERKEVVSTRSFESQQHYDENPMRSDFERHRQQSLFVETKLAGQAQEVNEPRVVESKEDVSVHITAPIVGTAYFAPSPSDPSFVKIGDKIDKNTVVCIIEAMKVMNEVKAGISGTIAELLCENGQPVEFGTKLFRIIPS